MDRWREYEAGTLTPPCVVQHDCVNGEHLIWVWDGITIHGPLSRPEYDEASCIAHVAFVRAEPPRVPDPAEQVAQLKAENDTLRAEKVVLTRQRDDALLRAVPIDVPPVERVR